MTFLKARWLIVVMLGLVTLAGCGGSGSNVVADPLAKGNTAKTDPSDPAKVANYTLSLIPGKSTVAANDEQLVTATLTDANGRPVPDQLISFSIVAGPATAVTTAMKTDSSGVALGFVRTVTTTATTNVIVQASAFIAGGNVSGYGNFQVSPSDASVPSTRLSMSVSSFTVKPNEQLFVSATARDSAGTPIANQVIRWEISAGPAAMLDTTTATDSNGVAVARIQAGAATAVSNVIVKAITASGGGATGVIPFQIAPPSVSVLSYTMTMVPSKAVVDNNEEFYVVATLKDSGGNPVIIKPVCFRIASGEDPSVTDPTTVKTETVNTDSTGKAIAKVRAGNPGGSVAIIIEASVTIDKTLVTALAPVQIMTKQYSESVLQMKLKSDKTSVGINSDVIIAATITDMQAPPKPVQNRQVAFKVIAGPASVIDEIVTTDSTGTAVSRLHVDSTTESSSSIIIQATGTVDKVKITSYTTIYVVRQNSYIINFLTTKTSTDPDGNLETMKYELKDPYYAGPVVFKQLVPFQVLDNNGTPKPNVDVTIAVSNFGRNPDTTIDLVPPLPALPVRYPATITVRTDDHGMGIFACNVTLSAPGPGMSNTESVIYSATASTDNVGLFSYGGFIATVTQVPKSL